MRRFTATEKWSKEWFQHLSPRLKCFWLFICDNADAAGVWEPNFSLASFQIGDTVTDADLVAFGDRLERLPNGKLRIGSFLKFQYGNLSENCKAHIPVFRALEKHNLLGRHLDSLPSRLQEKETETEGDRKGSAEGEPEPPPSDPPKPRSDFPVEMQDAAFFAAWDMWLSHVAHKGRDLTPMERKSLVIACQRAGIRRTVQVIDFSISKGAKNLIWGGPAKDYQPVLIAFPKASEVAAPEPPGWREWVLSEYPTAKVPGTWRELDSSVRDEFRHAHPGLGWKGARYVGKGAA